MSGRWRFLDNLNITTRLVFWFFVIALVPVMALTLITHFLSVRSLELTARRQLTSIRDAKADTLENLIRERRNDAVLIGQIPKVAEALTALGDGLEKRSFVSTPGICRAAQVIPLGPLVRRRGFWIRERLPLRLAGRLVLCMKPELSLGDNLLSGPLKESRLADAFHQASHAPATHAHGIRRFTQGSRSQSYSSPLPCSGRAFLWGSSLFN